MDYAIKTLGQLRPILLGFRKSAGLTQAAVAELLGITQQSYAQLEANPASVSVERLFKVMRLLNVELRFSHTLTPSVADSETLPDVAPKRRRPVSVAKQAKAPSAPNRSARTQKPASPKQPPKAIKTKKKRENW